MKVLKADHAGFCYGVTRALDMTDDALARCGEVCTLGPLIHNPQVVADLEQRGAHVAMLVDDIDCPTVVIRSHGAAPEVRSKLSSRDLDIVDATCPHVARAQAAAAELVREGCYVLVVGEPEHPEVSSLVACVAKEGGVGAVVAAPSDIPEDLPDNVGVVVQTTQMHDVLDRIVAALRARGIEPVVRDTICLATSQRQKAAAELAGKVDAMVVIGGRNSSNTTRLAEISLLYCPRVIHVESADELAPYAAELAACDVVGVTAGASTPDDQIDEVVAYLEGM